MSAEQTSSEGGEGFTELDALELAEEIWEDEPTDAEQRLMQRVLTSDWLADRLTAVPRFADDDLFNAALARAESAEAALTTARRDVEELRGRLAKCSRCGLRDVLNKRPHDDIVVCEPCMHEVAEELRADAWDEGHRFTGYEPEPGENPYRAALANPNDETP